jgi:DNA-binding transcriptional ArsR family regulator
MTNDNDKGNYPIQPMQADSMQASVMPNSMMPNSMTSAPMGMTGASGAAGSEMMISSEEIAELALRADAAAELLRTLANRYRIMILCQVAIKERSVTELAGLVGMNLSTLSLHLGRLRREGLVLTRRVAHQVFYRIGEGSVREIMTVLYHVYCRKVEAMNQGRMTPTGMNPPSMNQGGMMGAAAKPMMPMMPQGGKTPDENS